MSDAETLGVTVRFSVEDHRRLRVAAAAAGGPMTELVRRLVLRYLDRQVPVEGEADAGPSRREPARQVAPRFKK